MRGCSHPYHDYVIVVRHARVRGMHNTAMHCIYAVRVANRFDRFSIMFYPWLLKLTRAPLNQPYRYVRNFNLSLH